MSEGEGSPLRPARRRVKVMLVSSTSESESDESVSVPLTRRKRLRVLSDDGASSSSGSDVVARPRRVLPALRDSDSDTSDWATDHSDLPSASTVTPPAPQPAASGFASDSSEGNCDKCSICLLRFKDQEIGTPESCEHIFCVDCIVEWSKNVNTCPVDRMTFNSIVVRTRVGGRVLRTEAVKVMDRRPSVDVLVVEDPTPCEICGRTENEETMLLCDGCDLGFHMHCLTPPLTEVPADQWLCPSCDELLDSIHLSELDELFSGIEDFDFPAGPRTIGEARTARRSVRNRQTDGPSTSSGRTSGRSVTAEAVPSTSRGTRRGRSSRATGSRAPRRRTTGTTRRKAPRRRAKTVIVEYEVQGNSKFPITKTVTRKVKKRKKRARRPRTAARRTHVRASVRAKLADLRLQHNTQALQLSGTASGVQQLNASRQRAGIPALSLFGDPHTLDYFSEEEYDVAEGTSVAVAARPNRSAISAYRQARRKMVSIPSPVHASAAPDILSSILESQTLLHSKKSILSVSVDGQVDIKLEKRERPNRESLVEKRADPTGDRSDRLDVTKGEDAAKKTPAYGGGHQRSGGWGGGYRGSRMPPAAPHAQHYGAQGSAPPGEAEGARPSPSAPGYGPADYARRPHYAPPEQLYDRVRPHSNRTPLQPRPERGRYSGPVWRTAFPRNYNDDAPARHSFGGFDNPLDMRTGPPAPMSSALAAPEMSNSGLPPIRPMPEPPRFYFGAKPDEEEEAAELVIDTDKYDPTEPTHDDDSSDEDEPPLPLPPPPAAPEFPTPTLQPPVIPVPLTAASELLVPDLLIPGLLAPQLPASVAHPANKCPPPPLPPPAMQSILAEIDTDSLNVPPNVLTTAVRQVLEEHRQHLIDKPAPQRSDYSGEDSDGDCPNFSIYSATSVHIASTSNMEEISNAASAAESPSSRTKIEEYNEIVSKRCPITTNLRSPIKIKINTGSALIKRPVSIYDDEQKEPENDEEVNDPTEPATPESDPRTPEKQSIVSETPEEEPSKKLVDADKKLDDLRDEDNDERPDDLEADDNNEKPEDLKEDNKVEEEAEVESNTKEDIITPEPPEEETIILDSNEAEIVKSQREVEADKQDPEADGATALENGDLSLENEDTAFEDEVTALEDAGTVLEDGGTTLEDRVTPMDDVVMVMASEDTALDEDKFNEEDRDDTSEKELELLLGHKGDAEKDVEKMTESISETEDERSYTPCLDENKSKDNSFETEKDKGIEGLDTEMISEEEGQDMFSDEQELTPPIAHNAPAPAPAPADDAKKKKKKEPKKEGKDKKVKTKKSEVTFKKLSKTNKDRNYRDKEKNKDKDTDKSKKEKSDAAERKAKRKEKRKDLERYDVRTLVSEKRKRVKDAFGRDVSLARSRSGSAGSGRPASRRRRRDEPGERSPRRSLSSKRRKSTSPRRRSISPRRSSISPRRRSISPRRRSISPRRRSISPRRRSVSPRRRSVSPRRRSISPRRRSISPRRRSISPRRRSISPRRRSISPRRRRSMSSRIVTSAPSPSFLKKKSHSPRRKSISPPRGSPPRGKKRRSASRPKKRRRSGSRGSVGPRPKGKKKKRVERADSPVAAVVVVRDPKRKAKRVRRGRSPDGPPPNAPAGWSPPPSVDSRLLSPRTPPPGPEPARRRHRRRAPGASSQPSKEVFTSGDNILVSVSFNDEERTRTATDKRLRRAARKERRKRRRRAAAAQAEAVKPVAIIDLERSPFRELTPSPKNVIVLSDSDHGEAAAERARHVERNSSPPAPAPSDHTHVGPKTPPEPSAPVKFTIASIPARVPASNPLREETEPEASAAEGGPGPSTPPSPPSPALPYDPFDPTRSCSPSPPDPLPAAGGPSPPPSPPRTTMTLEAAQKTNMSADDVIARRPVSPIEKVMALLQSTRDVSPEPPPGDAPPPSDQPLSAPALPLPPPASSAPPPTGAAAPRIVLPSPTRSAPPKLFLAKPSPIKSNPVKPMPASQPSRLPLPLSAVAPRNPPPDDSPYSPGSSDFGDLFEPPPLAPRRHDSFDALFDKPARRRGRSAAAKVPVRLNKKKGKTQVGVKIDEDNLKILDELPSSAVEMEVKSKFLKKLNRQERVVEEVKLVLKPHYNKKHVTKEEYKDVLRRAVPKICHNKTGEINPSKIQALVEAYVKRIRKKHKLGLA